MDSVEKERAALSRELHDGPMQDLYALFYNLEAKYSGKFRDEDIDSIRNEFTQVIQKLRNNCRDLRPPSLAAFGLANAITEHASRYQESFPDLLIQLNLMPEAQQRSNPARLALYRIYQVALNNAVRHAQAAQVVIRLSLDAEFAYLEIKDDGVGFEVPKRWIDFARKGHLGLVGAKERAEAVNGQLEVQSEPGKGTLIKAVVPIL